MSQRVAVTGATGYLGAAIAAQLSAAGETVIALGRRPAGQYEWRSYELGGPLSPGLLDGIDSVVHCAYDLRLTSWADIESVNIGGTSRLVDAAAQAGARVQLVSSMSAYSGTNQLYGRAKLACESAVLKRGGNAIRPGLVYGGGDGGMVGTLRRIARLPVIPVFGARSHQFTVHIDDAARGFQRLVATDAPSGMIAGLAHPDPISFGNLIRRLAAPGTRPRIVPIPWRPVYLAMQLAERAGVSLPIRADSVLGLVRPAPGVPNPQIWRDLAVEIRPFSG